VRIKRVVDPAFGCAQGRWFVVVGCANRHWAVVGQWRCGTHWGGTSEPSYMLYKRLRGWCEMRWWWWNLMGELLVLWIGNHRPHRRFECRNGPTFTICEWSLESRQRLSSGVDNPSLMSTSRSLLARSITRSTKLTGFMHQCGNYYISHRIHNPSCSQ